MFFLQVFGQAVGIEECFSFFRFFCEERVIFIIAYLLADDGAGFGDGRLFGLFSFEWHGIGLCKVNEKK